MRVKLRLRAGAGQMRIGFSRFLKRGTRGFTLVELLAVMAIIGILSGMVAGAVTGLGTSGLNAQIVSDTKVIETAADRFLNASFPETYPVETFLVAKQPGWTGLGDHDPTSVQPGLSDLVVLFCVKFVGRPAFQWVDQIHDHYVEAFLSVLQECPGVLVTEIKPWVVKTTLMVVRQKPPA